MFSFLIQNLVKQFPVCSLYTIVCFINLEEHLIYLLCQCCCQQFSCISRGFISLYNLKVALCWEKFYITVNKFQQAQRNHNHTKTQRFTCKSFLLEGKTTGQTPNNFTTSNRDYNTQRYNLSKKNLSFSFHLLLSSSLYIFSFPLYFSLLFCLLSLTQFFKTTPVLTLQDFTYC